MKKIVTNRRRFIRYLGLITLFLFSWLTKGLIDKTKKIKKKPFVKINGKSLEEKVNFIENIIIVKENGKVVFYSSKCMHLGCKINKSEGDILICPCHGSKYGLNGEVIEGPASKELKKLNYSYNEKDNFYMVENV